MIHGRRGERGFRWTPPLGCLNGRSGDSMLTIADRAAIHRSVSYRIVAAQECCREAIYTIDWPESVMGGRREICQSSPRSHPLISPARRNTAWERFREGPYVAIGWLDDVDLTGKSIDEIIDLIRQKRYGTVGKVYTELPLYIAPLIGKSPPTKAGVTIVRPPYLESVIQSIETLRRSRT